MPNAEIGPLSAEKLTSFNSNKGKSYDGSKCEQDGARSTTWCLSAMLGFQVAALIPFLLGLVWLLSAGNDCL